MKCTRCFRKIESKEKREKGCVYCEHQEFVFVKELVVNDNNPRKISRNELKKLIKSIEENGFVDPVIVNVNPEKKMLL